MLENCNNNDHDVQVELDTHIKEETIKNSGSFSLEDQQHGNIALGRPKRIVKAPIRYDFEDLVSYTLIISSTDPTTF